MVAVATLSINEIETCLKEQSVASEFLAATDLAWIKKEIIKLYNLRYQVDDALTGPMMKIIVVNIDDAVNEDAEKYFVDLLKLNLKKYHIVNPEYTLYELDKEVRRFESRTAIIEFIDNTINIEYPPTK
jgi:hypothetical protein